MTSEHHGHEPPQYADRRYRSSAGIAAGVALLVVVAWLASDAIVRGTGRVPWITLAGLVFGVPLIVAFTLRPVVVAGEERLRIRNPFRTITMTWPAVQLLRGGYTNEVFAEDKKYQLWSIPVSLRARKSANRHNARVRAGVRPSRGLLGFGGGDAVVGDDQEKRASSDESMDELREIAERHGGGESHGATGETGTVTVQWAYEVLVPTLIGAVALLVLYLTS
jgi:PH (Pleckstrin Homology) domain-containing protein